MGGGRGLVGGDLCKERKVEGVGEGGGIEGERGEGGKVVGLWGCRGRMGLGDERCNGQRRVMNSGACILKAEKQKVMFVSMLLFSITEILMTTYLDDYNIGNLARFDGVSMSLGLVRMCFYRKNFLLLNAYQYDV